MAVAPAETLFRDADLCVRLVPGGSGECCVVTFAPLSDTPGLDQPGFGEEFFAARGIAAVHVVPRGNHWYQYPGTLAAMAAVRAAVRPYGRVVAYGSSMGAYAALRLGGAAGAGVALALSPQFSVRADRVPFEYRWSSLESALCPVWEDTLPLPELPEAYVVFDPRDLDARHAGLYEAGMRTLPVRLRGGGHPVTGFLNSAGMLQELVLAACRGPLDPVSIERDGWAARRRSADYCFVLAGRAGVPTRQVALLRHAVALAPHSAHLLSHLGLVLGRAGQFDEALDAHRRALAVHPGLVPLLLEYGDTLEAAGDLAEAAAQLEQVVAQGRTEVAPRLRQLRVRLGAEPGACRPTVSRNPGPRPPPGTPPVLSSRGEVGFVLHGPSVELQPGRYEVTFTVDPRPGRAGCLLDWRTACTLDVTTHHGRTVLARRRLTVAALRAGHGRVTLPFTVPDWTACEFRARTTGRIGLAVQPQRPLRRVRPPAPQA